MPQIHLNDYWYFIFSEWIVFKLKERKKRYVTYHHRSADRNGTLTEKVPHLGKMYMGIRSCNLVISQLSARKCVINM